MSDGKWSGGIANRNWARPGSRYYREPLTAADRHELYLAVADLRFWCETCGGHHPLREHRTCRDPQPVDNLCISGSIPQHIPEPTRHEPTGRVS